MFKDRKFVALLLLVVAILVSGMVFYSNVEHWSLLDSLYFSTVTLTTVGYGDFAPHTDLGKSFTIFYLLLGIGVLLSLIAIIADHAINNYRKFTEAYILKTEQKSENEKKS